jgi:hypothetical protein
MVTVLWNTASLIGPGIRSLRPGFKACICGVQEFIRSLELHICASVHAQWVAGKQQQEGDELRASGGPTGTAASSSGDELPAAAVGSKAADDTMTRALPDQQAVQQMKEVDIEQGRKPAVQGQERELGVASVRASSQVAPHTSSAMCPAVVMLERAFGEGAVQVGGWVARVDSSGPVLNVGACSSCLVDTSDACGDWGQGHFRGQPLRNLLPA